MADLEGGELPTSPEEVLAYNAAAAAQCAEAEACLREALELSEASDYVLLQQCVLTSLANMSCDSEPLVGPAEAAALRARLNALYVQTGRNPDTSCTICLEPLEQPAGDAPDDGGCGAAGGCNDSAVLVKVLGCGHQFHQRCLSTWWRTQPGRMCPLCMG